MIRKGATVCSIFFYPFLFSAAPFAAAKAPRPAKGDIQIEISLTGIIEKTGVSYCMDGAKYQILHTVAAYYAGPAGH